MVSEKIGTRRKGKYRTQWTGHKIDRTENQHKTKTKRTAKRTGMVSIDRTRRS